MADAPKPEISAVRIVQDIPVVYGDTILSHSAGPGISKLYVARYDPDPYVIGPNKESIVLQIIMPTENFVRTVSFLEQRVNQMVKAGMISQALLDETRRYWQENPPPDTANG